MNLELLNYETIAIGVLAVLFFLTWVISVVNEYNRAKINRKLNEYAQLQKKIVDLNMEMLNHILLTFLSTKKLNTNDKPKQSESKSSEQPITPEDLKPVIEPTDISVTGDEIGTIQTNIRKPRSKVKGNKPNNGKTLGTKRKYNKNKDLKK